jgi:hypothetical protein
MTFDVQSFLNAKHSGANATEFKPLPVATYTAVLTKPEIKEWSSRDSTKNGLKLTYQAAIQDQVPGFTNPSVRGDILLDLAEGGGLAMGDTDNVKLGRLRKAIGMNDPAKPWAFSDFEGKLLKVSVTHRPDPNDATKVYNEINAVFPAA